MWKEEQNEEKRISEKEPETAFCDPDRNSADHICGTGIPHLGG